MKKANKSGNKIKCALKRIITLTVRLKISHQ